MTDVAKKILWMCRVMQESEFDARCDTPVRSDNQWAIDWTAAEQPSSARAKHMTLCLYFFRDSARNGTITVQYVSSEHNDANILTKPVGRLVLVKVIKHN